MKRESIWYNSQLLLAWWQLPTSSRYFTNSIDNQQLQLHSTTTF